MNKLISFICLLSLVLVSCTEEPNYRPLEYYKSPKAIMYSGSMVGLTRSNQEAPYWNGEAQVKPNDITLEEQAMVVEWFETHPDEVGGTEWPGFTNFYVQQLWYSADEHIAKNGQSYTSQNCVVQINTLEGENVFGGYDEFNKCRYLYNTETTGFTYNNSAAGYWSVRYKVAYIGGVYYIGFDVEGKPDGDQDANLNQHFINDPNGYYTDRIIKIVPADEKGNPIEDNIEEDDDNDEGIIQEKENHTDEVEVNLHGVDKNGEYLESHLSIHIRCATDVEIYIPMDMRYVCEADDLDIVMKHEINHMAHNFEWTLKDSDLKVSISVVYEENGVRITTQGVNQDVIDWCRETCQDGITFEVWNYFNDLFPEELCAYLNKATIRFLDKEPEYYINAFTGNEGDCEVKIVEGQSEDYEFLGQGEHLNSSPYNDIYRKE